MVPKGIGAKKIVINRIEDPPDRPVDPFMPRRHGTGESLRDAGMILTHKYMVVDDEGVGKDGQISQSGGKKNKRELDPNRPLDNKRILNYHISIDRDGCRPYGNQSAVKHS